MVNSRGVVPAVSKNIGSEQSPWRCHCDNSKSFEVVLPVRELSSIEIQKISAPEAILLFIPQNCFDGVSDYMKTILESSAFQVLIKFVANESGQVFALAGQFGLELRPVRLNNLVK